MNGLITDSPAASISGETQAKIAADPTANIIYFRPYKGYGSIWKTAPTD